MYCGFVLQEGGVGRDGQDRRTGKDDHEGDGGAVKEGHGLRKHLKSPVLLHCSELMFGAPCPDVLIDMRTLLFNQMNIE